jgi:hypothetical protein
MLVRFVSRLTTRCPHTLSPDPHRLVDRMDIELPSVKKSSTDPRLPKRVVDRVDIELLKFT